MNGDELGPSESKLRELQWAGTEICLVYVLDGDYDPNTVTLEKLQGRDRVLPGLVRGIMDGYESHKFLVTLMTFQRQVIGTRTKTTLSKKRSSNDNDVFVGYDTFTCIESDEIDVCKWSPLERNDVGYRRLKETDDNEMFIGGILNEGGLRSMFVGRSPDESNLNSCTFYRSAIVICPPANAIKLDDAGPIMHCNRSWWVLREGCRAAPVLLQGSVKDQIAYHVMKQIRERTTKEHLISRGTYSLYRSQLEIALDILIDAGSWDWVLEFISTLANAVKDWPNNEKEFSDFISEAMICLHSDLPSWKKDELCRLAKERLSHLAIETRNGQPTMTHCQKGAVFNKDAKFSTQVEVFLRGDIEEANFSPFGGKDEARKWVEAHFSWHTFEGSWSGNSLEGEKAEIEGKYKASGTVNKAGTSVRLKKSSSRVLEEKVKIYQVQIASLDRLTPVFGEH